MRAAVYMGARRFEIQDLPVPEPGPGNVLVKVRYCGICGTDVHTFMYDVTPPGTQMGHEYSGTVVALGEGVTNWAIGDRIVGGGGTPPAGFDDPTVSDPRFNYRVMGPGREPMWGRGYAEFVEIEAWRPIAVPDGVSDEAAAMAEPLATAVHAVRRSALKIGDTVAVLGAGPIGLFTMQVARAAGASKIFVAEPAPARSGAAKALGADAVIDPTETDVEEAIVGLTDGVGPDVVFECAAAKGTLDDALRTVRKGGNVTLVSLAWEQTALNPVNWIAREIKFTTSFIYEPEDWKIGLDLIRKGKVTVEPLMAPGSVIGLDDLQVTFERLMAPASDIKMLLAP
jgi:(R,R)-butanediol dehydrogenase/meso-butanediol dehydrogenase/diacetyl reductase